jgi:hypothetical protein
VVQLLFQPSCLLGGLQVYENRAARGRSVSRWVGESAGEGRL